MLKFSTVPELPLIPSCLGPEPWRPTPYPGRSKSQFKDRFNIHVELVSTTQNTLSVVFPLAKHYELL